MNSKNRDNKCFKHSAVVALHHQNTESHPERISNIEIFIDQCNWEWFLAGIKDWKSLNKIIRQLLLISCLYHTMKKQ